MESSVAVAVVSEEDTLKLPQVNKNTRFYYRHREEIAAARKERLMADPEYVAKQEAKEAARVAREAAKAEREAKKKAREEALIAKEELKKQKRDLKAKLVGALPPV